MAILGPDASRSRLLVLLKVTPEGFAAWLSAYFHGHLHAHVPDVARDRGHHRGVGDGPGLGRDTGHGDEAVKNSPVTVFVSVVLQRARNW